LNGFHGSILLSLWLLKVLLCLFVWLVEMPLFTETGLARPLAGGLGYLYSFLALPFLCRRIGYAQEQLYEYNAQSLHGHPSL
jgi:hypothetical protein